MTPEIELRAVEAADLDALFAQQADEQSASMAGVPSRDRAAFDAHWAKITTDPENVIRVVVADRQVVGSALCFPRDGVREVGYWIDRSQWGRGIATAAVRLLLAEVAERPLHAKLLSANAGSRAVLLANGFRVLDDDGTETHMVLE